LQNQQKNGLFFIFEKENRKEIKCYLKNLSQVVVAFFLVNHVSNSLRHWRRNMAKHDRLSNSNPKI